jgi:hypothetical protein
MMTAGGQTRIASDSRWTDPNCFFFAAIDGLNELGISDNISMMQMRTNVKHWLETNAPDAAEMSRWHTAQLPRLERVGNMSYGSMVDMKSAWIAHCQGYADKLTGDQWTCMALANLYNCNVNVHLSTYTVPFQPIIRTQNAHTLNLALYKVQSEIESEQWSHYCSTRPLVPREVAVREERMSDSMRANPFGGRARAPADDCARPLSAPGARARGPACEPCRRACGPWRGGGGASVCALPPAADVRRVRTRLSPSRCPATVARFAPCPGSRVRVSVAAASARGCCPSLPSGATSVTYPPPHPAFVFQRTKRVGQQHAPNASVNNAGAPVAVGIGGGGPGAAVSGGPVGTNAAIHLRRYTQITQRQPTRGLWTATAKLDQLERLKQYFANPASL